MPRLFTGLEIPSDLAFELSTMRGGLFGARWIDVENYHLTLRFIGDVGDETANEIDYELGKVRRQPFPVTLQGLGVFGSDKPRAIVAKVQPSPALMEVQAEEERIMRRMGLASEPRKFTPHITLARLRGASPMAVADYLGARGFLTRRFMAEQVVLFSSRDSVGGGPYRVEAAYPFGQAASMDRRSVG